MVIKFVYSFITKPKHIFLVHGEIESQEVLKEKILENVNIPVTIPDYGQTYTLDENLTMEQTVEPVCEQIVARRDILEKMKTLKEELEDMETIIKEEYLSSNPTDSSMNLLKLRLNEIEDQIVKIVEKS
ncbi:MAG: MBL fold metallo-hydrolase RNA specificity domain-containing protein [Intestinibacter sp.]